MYRVITQSHDHRGMRIIEAGPWLASEAEAGKWASVLRSLGYVTRIEPMHGNISETQGSRAQGNAPADRF